MFREMRQALNIPPKHDILGFIRDLPTQPERVEALQTIRRIEMAALTTQTPQPGLRALMDYLEQRNVKKALCTRNFPRPVHHLLDTALSGRYFYPIVTRETIGIPPKPRPEGLWEIIRAWRGDSKLFKVSRDEPPASDERTEGHSLEQLDSDKKLVDDEEAWEDIPSPSQSPELVDEPFAREELQQTLGKGVIMVGDSLDDMIAGREAGAATVLLGNDENVDLGKQQEVDMVIESLEDLADVLEGGFIGRTKQEARI